MPYTSPARPGHRRSVSLFTDEKGPGAFQSLGTLPRRTPRTGGAIFHFREDEDDSSSQSDNDDAPPPPLKINPNNSLRLSLTPVPFPKVGPLSPSPVANGSPRPSPKRTESSPVLLSNGKPLKSSLKGSTSSPNIPMQHLPTPRALHLRARSAPSTPSLDIAPASPTTPKNVHFSSELESVRVFNRSGKPVSVSRPPGDETETETEGESAREWGGPMDNFGPSTGRLFPSAFPFPRFTTPAPSSSPLNPSKGYQLDLSSYPVPNANPPSYANVHFESLKLSTSSGSTSLYGTVLLRNLAFEKHVFVRFTLDDWQTTSEVTGKYVSSMQDLPVNLLPRTLGDVIAMPSLTAEQLAAGWDRFEFSIRLEDYLSNLESKTMWVVVRYLAPGVGEWWDNNSARNYRLKFKRAEAVKERSASAPTVPPLMLNTNSVAAPVLSKPLIPPSQSPTRSPQQQAAVSQATAHRLAKFSLKNYAKPGAVTPLPGSSPTISKTELPPAPAPEPPVVNIIGATPTKDVEQRPSESPTSSSESTPVQTPAAEAAPPSPDVLSSVVPLSPKSTARKFSSFGGLQWGWSPPPSSPVREPLSPKEPSSLVASIGALKAPSPRLTPPPPLQIPPVPALERSRTSSSSTSSSESLSSLDERLGLNSPVVSPHVRVHTGRYTPPRADSPPRSPTLQIPLHQPHPQKTLQTLHALRTGNSPIPSPLSGSPVNAESPETEVPPGDADSLYNAFVRQWCFATTQTAPPAVREGLNIGA